MPKGECRPLRPQGGLGKQRTNVKGRGGKLRGSGRDLKGTQSERRPETQYPHPGVLVEYQNGKERKDPSWGGNQQGKEAN